MSQFPYRNEPAWVSASTAETATIERDFLRSVYTWMFAGLGLTALSALLVMRTPALQQMIFGKPAIPWILFAIEFGLVMYLQVRITRMSAGAAAGAFLFYSFLNGLTFSAIFFVYTATSIAQAFFTAAGMFAGMSVWGYVTKRNLSAMGTFFAMGAWGLLILFLINIWVRSSTLSLVASAIGVVIFAGLTAYDTQQLKEYARARHGNLAVYGALRLYLDFINLFLMLLRLFGGRRD